MNRVVTPTVLLAVLLTGLGACRREAAPPPRPLNVVFIVLDTLRPDRLGIHGNPRRPSPHLDAFLERTCLFEEAQTVAPWTAPSLITLMTGLHPEAHGVLEHPEPARLSEEVVTLAEVLSREGYETAAFTEGGYAKPQFGLAQGFDVYPPLPGDETEVHSIHEHGSRIARNVDRTLEWLRGRGGRPFFLFFHTYETHQPYRAPQELVRRFVPGFDDAAEHERIVALVERWNREKEISREGCVTLLLHRLRTALIGIPRIEDSAGLYARARELGIEPRAPHEVPEVVERARALYDATVVHADLHVQRLLAALEEAGRLEDTLIVLVSDHGEALGEHEEMQHGEGLHEPVMRILLAIRDPALPPRRVTGVASIADVAPTVLDRLGRKGRLPDASGRSLLPRLRGEEADEPAFSHGLAVTRAADPFHGVRTREWRLILDAGTGGARLFDRRADPAELADVASAHPGEARRLADLVRAHRARMLLLGQRLGPTSRPAGLDAATLEDLKRLGYVGEDEPR